MTRAAIFRACAGEGARLAERLLHAASLVAEAPGCELWLVDRDRDDPDTVRVTEVWASCEQCEAALNVPGVRENAEQVMELVEISPEAVDGETLGGARMLRGTTGATAFPILDAPDLSKDTDLLGRYDLDEVGEARYVRGELGAVQTGLTHYRLPPGRRQGWAHRHRVAEQIYVALSGTGRMKVDDELFELRPLHALRVAPASVREVEAGSEGLEVLAFRSHSPGDGEMVAEWWTT
jgi:mannose-6-phosphate isomerase-like protein (cupin superfamily)/quinol monooxygenase YgiN